MENYTNDFFYKVEGHLIDYDYDGLIASGAPGNEFAGEARKICERITVEHSVEEIAEIIADVFSKNFLTTEKPKNFLELAQKIKKELDDSN